MINRCLEHQTNISTCAIEIEGLVELRYPTYLSKSHISKYASN